MLQMSWFHVDIKLSATGIVTIFLGTYILLYSIHVILQPLEVKLQYISENIHKVLLYTSGKMFIYFFSKLLHRQEAFFNFLT